ncbi:MAG TPA: hypothetical protein PK095_06700 [Myxococcota bacterium]|nr:hypothetical protein [Myxococcota bacterium]
MTYDVRAAFAGGTTTWSSSATGRRAVGVVGRLWEYATDAASPTWVTFPAETCPSTETRCDDLEASSLGLERYYRLTLNAPGATPLTTEVVSGRRLAFTEVNGGFYSMCAIDTLGRLWTWGRFRPAGNPDEDDWLGTLVPRVRDEGPFTSCSSGGVEGAGSEMFPPGFGCAMTTEGGARCGIFLTDESLTDMTELGSGLRALDVGPTAACAVDAQGQARCWGRGALLGNLLGSDSATPGQVLEEDGTPLIDLTGIDVGAGHVCARSSAGLLWCWGENSAGQLGDDEPGTRHFATEVPGISAATSVVVGQNHTCSLLANEELRCFGQNAYGELGDGTQDNRTNPGPVFASLEPDVSLASVKQAIGFQSTTCALRPLNSLCWGEGWEGQRGDGTYETAAPLPRLVQLPGPATDIAGGRSTACAIVDGSIWCWGSGHLGDGTTTARATPGEVTLP